MNQSHDDKDSQQQSPDPWKQMTRRIGAVLLILSVLSCVVIATIRSKGLTAVKITALDAKAEPRDHNLPLIKQKAALPDYEVAVILTSGRKIQLGAKPNKSAIDGLSWQLNAPVSVSEIAGIRLLDQDKVVSDEITEVQLTDSSVTEGNYRFDFETSRSFGVGVVSFFQTPIGKTITGAFFVAIVTILVSIFIPGAGSRSVALGFDQDGMEF